MAQIAGDPVTAVSNVVNSVIDRLWPSPTEAAEAKLKFFELQQNGFMSELTEQAGIVKTEAASTHWLAANWRPITMLVFVALIAARWLGFAAPNLAPGEYMELWEIVKLGLGGYVIGRSVEKVTPSIAAALGK